MNRTEPPLLATWLLEHQTTGGRDEALAGDLREEFRAGRSSGWYWRQVITAIAIGWARSIFQHRLALLFAVIWSVLSPAWELTFIRVYSQSGFVGPIVRIPWPWSTACFFGLSILQGLLFIWIGSLLYVALLVCARKTVDFRRLGRGFLMSIVVYFFALACDFALWITIGAYSNGDGTDWRTLTLVGVIRDFGAWDILEHFKYIVGTACAIWGGMRRFAKTSGVPA
jgi:hypothetical protein